MLTAKIRAAFDSTHLKDGIQYSKDRFVFNAGSFFKSSFVVKVPPFG